MLSACSQLALKFFSTCSQLALGVLEGCSLAISRRLLAGCSYVALRLLSCLKLLSCCSEASVKWSRGCAEIALRLLSGRFKLFSFVHRLFSSCSQLAFKLFMNLISACSGCARRLFPCNLPEIARRLLLRCAPIVFMFKVAQMLL